MKPIITIVDSELSGKEFLSVKLATLVIKNEAKGIVEFKPKNKKATEVIRILRENGINYQIRFDALS
jgi:hypothetical protein